MNRANPESVAAALKAAQVLIDAGVDWVPVPCMDQGHKEYLASYGVEVLESLAQLAEAEEHD